MHTSLRHVGFSGISVKHVKACYYFLSGAVQGMGGTKPVSGMTGSRLTGLHKDANYTNVLLDYLGIPDLGTLQCSPLLR
jgi:ABC-type uncharacterized transport system permease subunit